MYKFLDILFAKRVSLFMYFSVLVLAVVDVSLTQFLLVLVLIVAVDMFYFAAWYKLNQRRMAAKVEHLFEAVKKEAKRRDTYGE